jgi:hypothetical protein
MTIRVRDTQAVHSYFRGAAEVSKRCGQFALISEVFAAAVVLPGVMRATTFEPWAPFVSFLLLAVAAGFRVFADRFKAFADKCRRISMRAYAWGHEIPVVVASNIRADAPPGALSAAERLPAYKMGEYYEVQSDPGESRLREIYAYSAFYSGELLTKCKWIYVVLATGILIGAMLVLYTLAVAASAPGRQFAMEALFSVVLSTMGLRVLQRAIAFQSASDEVKRISDALPNDPLPTGDQLKDLVFEYESSMAAAPSIPTSVYKFWRKKLDAAWRHRRRAIISSPGQI